MILNGKCKEKFLEWMRDKYSNAYDVLNSINPIISNALIIEFFDSVGIYISLNYVSFYDEFRNDKGFEAYVTNNGLSVKFRSLNSRQQATEQAIKKANDIYNERFK